MRTGLYVLCAFAAAWGAVALYTLGAPAWTGAAPAVVSIAIAVVIGPKVFASAQRSPQEGRRTGRVVMLWSGVEVVAILLAASLLPRFGLTRLFMPSIALIVGVHFFPLARSLPYRPFHATAAAMTATSLLAMLLPGGLPTTVSAAAGAVILWLSALYMGRVVGPTAPA